MEQTDERVLAILKRRREIALENAMLDQQKADLATEWTKLDDQLQELVGLVPPGFAISPLNGDRKQMKCSVCGELGHNSKRHSKEVS
jgi:hypothetical protein